MINFDFDSHCCGCAVCADVCRQQCINIVENRHGFRVPKVNVDNCVECGLCEKICPILNTRKLSNDNQRCYSSYHLNPEIRQEGSSGSMFYLLADWILSQGGVVFGAAFDEHLQLKHTIATNIEELRPLMKSKYLQSNTNGIFNRVNAYLNKKKLVLFVGTPCQCQAMYNCAGGNRDFLYLVDLICHGVPSQHLFNRYINDYEKTRGVHIEDFNFRVKPMEGNGREDDVHHYMIKGQTNSGNRFEETGHYSNCSFYVGFKKYQIYRNSCYECKFVGKNRITDFTLGDFWHLTEINPDVHDFFRGYSQFIVNTDRGQQLFELLKGKCYSKEYSMDFPMKRNHAYSRPTNKTIVRTLFFSLYNIVPYRVLSRLFFEQNGKFFTLLSLPQRLKMYFQKKRHV